MRCCGRASLLFLTSSCETRGCPLGRGWHMRYYSCTRGKRAAVFQDKNEWVWISVLANAICGDSSRSCGTSVISLGVRSGPGELIRTCCTTLSQNSNLKQTGRRRPVNEDMFVLANEDGGVRQIDLGNIPRKIDSVLSQFLDF